MRDKGHDEFLVWWANFVREHPNEWRKHTTPFIDSQIIMANRFYKNLAKTKEGREKIREILSRQ